MSAYGNINLKSLKRFVKNDNKCDKINNYTQNTDEIFILNMYTFFTS